MEYNGALASLVKLCQSIENGYKLDSNSSGFLMTLCYNTWVGEKALFIESEREKATEAWREKNNV